MLHSFIVPKGQ